MLDGREMGVLQIPARSRNAPPHPAPTNWPGGRHLRSLSPPDPAYRLDISFDLSLPLPPQLEAAKFRLVSRATELRRNGLAAPKTVANQREHWTQMLRRLDAEAAGIAVNEADADLLREAQAMVRGGYLDILRLAAAE